MIFWIISWLVYGLVVGSVAKWLHPGDDPSGILATLGIGVVGSYIGGFLNYLIFGAGTPFSPSGIIMGIIGATIFCWIYSKVKDHGNQQ